MKAALPTLVLLLALAHSDASSQTLLPGDPSIAYWQIGEPRSDRVIVVVHGGAGVPHNYLRPEWDALAALGRVVYYDQRGCGQSARPGSYTWQDHVADLRRLIAEVSPGRPVVLAGSSWGSVLASLYVTQHPNDVQALVLSGIGETAPRISRDRVRLLPELELPGDLDLYRMPEPPRFPGPILRPTSESRATVERQRMNDVLAPRHTEDCVNTRVATFESLRTVPPALIDPTTLGVPVLAIVDNRFDMPFEVSAAAPEMDGNVTKVVGGGHDPWLDHRDAFFTVVGDFLRGVWGR
jgi:pimeloyl-ACP methyl ester carboxylesterase